MKKKIFLVLLILIFSAITFADPEINGKAYVVADAITGQIIYQKNMNERYPMASTTKLMTCLCYLENGDLNKPVVYSQEAKDTPYPNMRFKAGTILSSNDALNALMLPSSNDMATAIGIAAGGNIDNFLKMMNHKAKVLGMNNTHYACVHGLDTDGHFSSCYDLSILAKEIWKNPYFRTLPKPEYKIKYTENGTEKEKLVTATYKEMFDFDGFKGMKTGTTTKAGKCFVGYFDREPNPIITVVLGSKDAMADTKTLVNYTYNNCRLQTLYYAGKPFLVTDGETSFGARVKNDVTVFAEKNAVFDNCFSYEITPFVTYPVKEGDFVAILTIKSYGRPIMSLPLYSMSKVQKNGEKKAG